MSHLIAYFGNDPDRLACGVFAARNALYVSSSGQSQAWGLGFIQAGEVLLQKRPRPNVSEVDFYGLAKDLKAEALIAKAVTGDDGLPPAEDGDPFRFRSWLFGTIGSIEGFESIKAEVVERIPGFLRRNIRGRSASEHLFHLMLAALHDQGLLDNPMPQPEALRAVLTGTLDEFDRLLSAAGQPAMRIASIASNGRTLIASGRSHVLEYLPIGSISDCPVCRGRLNLNGDKRRIPHEQLRAVVLSAGDSARELPGWQVVPSGACLVASANGAPQVLTTPATPGQS